MCVCGGGGLRERQKEEDWEEAEWEDSDLGFASFSLITLSMRNRKLIPMLLYHAWCQAMMRLNICFPIFPISIHMVASLKTMNM